MNTSSPRTYHAMHAKVRRVRGSASAHQCVAPDCEKPARQWGWMHTGPSTTGESRGFTIEFGLDVSDYSPMCISHNRMLDAGGSWTHCPQGHERAKTGTYGDGGCRGCRRRS